jgi:hypothetical protein
LLAVESDEDEQPVRNKRRMAGNSMGDSSQADDILGSAPSRTASATSSTNKRKRLVQMDDDDDDDDGIVRAVRLSFEIHADILSRPPDLSRTSQEEEMIRRTQ